jgi:hypothetical protein
LKGNKSFPIPPAKTIIHSSGLSDSLFSSNDSKIPLHLAALCKYDSHAQEQMVRTHYPQKTKLINRRFSIQIATKESFPNSSKS